MKLIFRNAVIYAVVMLIMAVFPQKAMFASSPLDFNTEYSKVLGLAGEAYTVLRIAGSIAAIAVIIMFAIKWFTAKPQERAALQGKAWAYFVGALILFAGLDIGRWVIDIFLGIKIFYPV